MPRRRLRAPWAVQRMPGGYRVTEVAGHVLAYCYGAAKPAPIVTLYIANAGATAGAGTRLHSTRMPLHDQSPVLDGTKLASENLTLDGCSAAGL